MSLNHLSIEPSDLHTQRVIMDHVSIQSTQDDKLKLLSQRIDQLQNEIMLDNKMIDFDKSVIGKEKSLYSESR